MKRPFLWIFTLMLALAIIQLIYIVALREHLCCDRITTPIWIGLLLISIAHLLMYAGLIVGECIVARLIKHEEKELITQEE